MTTVLVFDAGDGPYIAWRDANPNGFILNAARGQGNKSLKLHQSNCYQAGGIPASKDGFTKHNYFKVCSNDLGDLLGWIRTNRKREAKWCATCAPAIEAQLLPDEVQETGVFPEGSTHQVSVNAYERSAAARKACIAHYGHACAVCGFDFGKFFGSFAEGYIHVHHIVPLHKIASTYEVDPVKDLRPVCPNCHAAIHINRSSRSIEELQNLISRHKPD